MTDDAVATRSYPTPLQQRGVRASRGIIGYEASKGAVKIMMRAAALELAPLGIRCIAIAPGSVETPIIANDLEMGLEPVLAKIQMRGNYCSRKHRKRRAAIMSDDGFASFKA